MVRDKALEVDLALENKPLRLEVDTGSAVSLVSEQTYKRLFPNTKLQPRGYGPTRGSL